LRKTLPLEHPVSVRRTKLSKGHDGECIFKNGKFIIKIQKNLPEFYSIDILIHEISHCLSWEKEKDWHGALWGKAYSLAYRKFLEWLELNERS